MDNSTSTLGNFVSDYTKVTQGFEYKAYEHDVVSAGWLFGSDSQSLTNPTANWKGCEGRLRATQATEGFLSTIIPNSGHWMGCAAVINLGQKPLQGPWSPHHQLLCGSFLTTGKNRGCLQICDWQKA